MTNRFKSVHASPVRFESSSFDGSANVVLYHFDSNSHKTSSQSLCPGATEGYENYRPLVFCPTVREITASLAYPESSNGWTRCSWLYRRYGDKVLRPVIWVRNLLVLPSAGSYSEPPEF